MGTNFLSRPVKGCHDGFTGGVGGDKSGLGKEKSIS
jgi:hypothetical protein